MNFTIKTTPDELKRARKWWQDLGMLWKFAYNEAVFGKGPTMAPPSDDELMLLLTQIDTIRFAGPFAPQPNITNPLKDLSGLVPLYQLKYLSISHMAIKSLKPLTRFTKMEYLFVYDNKLESLEGIENMTGLKDLYAQNNELSDISAIRKLTNIETLYISGNKLENLKGLTKQHEEKLRKLYVLPNEDLRDREILRVQNEVGIICRQG